MTNKEIKLALVSLGKKQKDLAAELCKRGISAAPCEISQALNPQVVYNPLKFQKIRNVSAEIIQDWEREEREQEVIT